MAASASGELPHGEREPRRILDSVPAPIALLDRQERFRFVNQAYADSLSLSRADFLGRAVSELASAERYALIKPHIERVLAGEEVAFTAEIVGRPGLPARVFETRYLPDRDERGAVVGWFAVHRDVTEQTSLERSLRRRSLELATVLDSVPAMVMRADGDERFTFANRMFAQEILGVSAADLIGRRIEEVVSPEIHAAIRPYIERVLRGEETVFERLEHRPGLPIRRFAIRYVPDRDASGEVVGWFAFATDITQERLMQEALEQRVRARTAELEAAYRELETFSYSVSHDLKTPLRAIEGFASLVGMDEGSTLSQISRARIERITANARHMGRLIEGLLEFSRLSRREMQRRRIDMRQLAARVVADLRGLSASAFEAEIGELPACEGDAVLLRQVLQNLVSNAIKYSSERAAPRIEIGARRGESGVVWFVRDNGVGFDMRYADKLFGVFERLHTPGRFEGTGIGLALARRIVERHGGRIWAESAPEAGATFYFSLGAGSADAG